MSNSIWAGYRIAPDGDDLLVYDMDQSAAPLLNVGILGAAGNMSQSGSGMTWPSSPSGGVYDGHGCMRFPGSGSPCNVYTADSIAEQAFPVTLSCWIHLYAYTPNYGTFVCKAWSSSSWGSPYHTFGIKLNSQQNGSWHVGMVLAGGNYIGPDLGNSDGKLRLVSGVWHHVGLTYDGAYMRVFFNGQCAWYQAETRALDYGSHGAWRIGQGSPSSDQLNGWISDVRFARVARSAQWFNDVWSKGQSFDIYKAQGIGGSQFNSAGKYARNPQFDATELLGINGLNYAHAGKFARNPQFDAESWGMPGPGFAGVTLYYSHRAMRISTGQYHFWNHTAPDPTGFYSGVSPADLIDITIIRSFSK